MYPPTTPWRAEQRDLPEHEIFSVHAGGVDRNFAGGQGRGGDSPSFLRSHGVELIDLHDTECIQMMSGFILAHPHLWNEDIGK